MINSVHVLQWLTLEQALFVCNEIRTREILSISGLFDERPPVLACECDKKRKPRQVDHIELRIADRTACRLVCGGNDFGNYMPIGT